MAFDQEDAFHDYETGGLSSEYPVEPEKSPLLPETHERLLSLESNLTAALQRVRRYGRGHNRTILLQRLEGWQKRLASLLSRIDDLPEADAAAFLDDMSLFLHGENFFQDLRKRHCKKGESPYARYITDIHETLCKTSKSTTTLPVVHKTRAALDGVLEEGPFPFSDRDAWEKNRIHLQSLEAYTATLVDCIHHFQINCSPMRWRIVSDLWTRHAAHPSLDHTIIRLRDLHRSIHDGIGAIDPPTVHDFLPLLEETVHRFRQFLPHVGAALDDLGSSAQERLFLDALYALQTIVGDDYTAFHATVPPVETSGAEEELFDDDDVIEATAVPVVPASAPHSQNSAAPQQGHPSSQLQHHPHRIALAVGAMIATLLHTHPSQEETPDIACTTGAVVSDVPVLDTETVAAPPENDAQKILGDASVDALIDGLLADTRPLAERLTDTAYFRAKRDRLLANDNHDAEKAFALADADYPEGGCTTVQQLLTSSSLRRDPLLWGQMAHMFNAVENAPPF